LSEIPDTAPLVSSNQYSILLYVSLLILYFLSINVVYNQLVFMYIRKHSLISKFCEYNESCEALFEPEASSRNSFQ